MNQSTRTGVRPMRGLVAWVLGFAGGGLMCAGLFIGQMLVEWLIAGSGDVDRRYDLAWLELHLPWPAVGCALVVGCAAFATWFPGGAYRFARSLALVFAMTIPLWIVVGAITDHPGRHMKGAAIRPLFDPVDLAAFSVPPLFAALILCLMRMHSRGALPVAEAKEV